MNRYSFYTLVMYFIFCACNSKVESEIPVFDLLLVDSTTTINTSTIPKGKVTMFVFFSPDCEHCQQETIDLIKHMDALKSIRFYFVSLASIKQINEFVDFYKLKDYSNIVVGKDYTSSFPRLSGLNVIPSSAIYDSNGRLRAVIKGQFTVDNVLEQVKNF